MMKAFYAVDKKEQDKVFSFDDNKSRNKWIKKDNTNRGSINEDQANVILDNFADVELWLM